VIQWITTEKIREDKDVAEEQAEVELLR